ncbi:hypothetical protein K435DRAFT_800859 [Dendrothele bispora CBS 962.96]|uniref:Uncharacterized protein n=1 Tax=Dendrothele bispora (strain CBS 962.96) TaxID=1314807 RepID=A0A4S8LR35_DENBC|nr:hypothetical protein K435DRAFT_800859 [Dendrothele bispora CBS 962.96]
MIFNIDNSPEANPNQLDLLPDHTSSSYTEMTTELVPTPECPECSQLRKDFVIYYPHNGSSTANGYLSGDAKPKANTTPTVFTSLASSASGNAGVASFVSSHGHLARVYRSVVILPFLAVKNDRPEHGNTLPRKRVTEQTKSDFLPVYPRWVPEVMGFISNYWTVRLSTYTHGLTFIRVTL